MYNKAIESGEKMDTKNENFIIEKIKKLKETPDKSNNIINKDYKKANNFSDMLESIQLNKIISSQIDLSSLQLITKRNAIIPGPESATGVVYKFDRGVIGITETGQVYEEILDGTNYHHGETTRKIGKQTGCEIPDEIGNPHFSVGVAVSLQGVLIIHLEGSAMFTYLPETISEEQYQSLEQEVIPRTNFEIISFTHNNQIYTNDDIKAETLLSFSKAIIKNEKTTSKTI